MTQSPQYIESSMPTTPSNSPSLSTLPTELITEIFKNLCSSNDLVSAVCLGLTCKRFHAVYKSSTRPFSWSPRFRVLLVERSFRALTIKEQARNRQGVMFIGPTLRELLSLPETPGSQRDFAQWGPQVILKRWNGNIFNLWKATYIFKPGQVDAIDARDFEKSKRELRAECRRLGTFEIARDLRKIGRWDRLEMHEESYKKPYCL